jgi:integrase
MSVKIRKRKNKDGTVSLRLDIIHNGERWYEPLDGLKLSKGNTLVEREQNKKNLKLAEAIRHTKAVELSAADYNIITSTHKHIEVVRWMEDYIDEYTKKDIRNMEGAKNRFKAFVSTKKNKVTFGNIDALLIEAFIDYLEKHSEGEGANSYYARFRKMLNYACRKKLMSYSVLAEVKKRPKGKASKRDILTLEELEVVARTPMESPEVRRAALFSAVTGLAWVDIKILMWRNVKYTYKKLEFVRTKQEDYNESVTVPLNDTAFILLGVKGDPDEPVFKLPSANGANKTLKRWVKRAGIDKIITWHNLRHSFGTNLILNKVDLLTTAKLMGHTTTKHTIRYVKASEEMQRTGTEKINIKLDF